jgi:putrescine importer
LAAGPANTTSSEKTQLRRALTLKDLIFYGIVLIQPIAAIPLFGIADKISQGHVAATIFIAMAAMMLTAFSYGKMAMVYPAAGSAYTYVTQGLNVHLGFFTGWAMVLDYLLIPIINTIYGALTLHRMFPSASYLFWTALLTVLMTFLNVLGVRSTARTNDFLLLIMSVVIVAFVFLAIRYLWKLGGPTELFSTLPFYDPKTFSLSSLATATSLAALTYIGFDGITTLSEEAIHPQRDILRATVLVCLLTGILSGVQVYLAQRVWPDYSSFPNAETAFMDVANRVGGKGLFQGFAAILVIASLGSGLAGQAGAARLLFGMGRDSALPRKFFGHLEPRRQVPVYNTILIGVIAFAGSQVLNFETAAELLNFGAFLAFMGVNLVALRNGYAKQHSFRSAQGIVAALGFLFCLWIWWHLPHAAMFVGSVWLALGVLYYAILTRGFRTGSTVIPFS